MISKLTGVLIEKNPPELLLDVNGVGYSVYCPMSSFYQIPNKVKNISLYTELIVREDSHSLYGFVTKDERTLFQTLIKVNGVGPKVALAILSSLSVSELLSCVSASDYKTLQKTPGVGLKTAQKMVVELKDRFEKLELISKPDYQLQVTTINKNNESAIAALLVLGFNRKEAENMIKKVSGNNLTTEEIIRLALKNK